MGFHVERPPLWRVHTRLLTAHALTAVRARSPLSGKEGQADLLAAFPHGRLMRPRGQTLLRRGNPRFHVPFPMPMLTDRLDELVCKRLEPVFFQIRPT
jgi:hypothetical protein